jgi:hypothetical protein
MVVLVVATAAVLVGGMRVRTVERLRPDSRRARTTLGAEPRERIRDRVRGVVRGVGHPSNLHVC